LLLRLSLNNNLTINAGRIAVKSRLPSPPRFAAGRRGSVQYSPLATEIGPATAGPGLMEGAER
jgi:hypothetical protein